VQQQSPFMLNGQLSAQAADAKHQASPFLINGQLSALAAGVGKDTDDAEANAVKGEECAICQYAMQELSSLLDDKATRKEIEDAVKSVCGYLPGSIQEECKQLIDEYGDAIIQLIDQFAKDPKEVCTELGLCAKAKPEPSPPAIVTKCEVCKMMVNYLDELIDDTTVLPQITSAVKKVCYLVPKHYFKKCKTIISVYGADILELLKVLGTPAGICEEVKLCRDNTKPRLLGGDYKQIQPHLLGGDYKKIQPRLLGGEKCTWGPDYWCQSKLHAKACQAEKHCTEKVWKQ